MTVGTYRFGNETPGTGDTGCRQINGGIFTSGANAGEAKSITARLSVVSDPLDFQCAIYLYGGPGESTFIKATEEKNLSNTVLAWVQFDFSAPFPAIAASTAYLLVAWSETGATDSDIGLEIAAFTKVHSVGLTYPNWANYTFFETADRRMDVYSDYDPLAPPAVAVKPLSLNLKARPKGGTGRPRPSTGGTSFGG